MIESSPMWVSPNRTVEANRVMASATSPRSGGDVMGVVRALGTLSVAALVFTSAGCGAGDELGRTTSDTIVDDEAAGSTIVDDEAAGSTTDAADRVAEPVDRTIADDPAAASEAASTDDDDDEATTPPPTDLPDEWSEVIDAAVPEGPAPVALAGVVLPTDVEGVIAVFEALPDELVGGDKSIWARTQGDLAADYMVPDRASRYGFQAADLPNSFWGGVLPEPRADMLVAFFVLGDDDDYTVEAVGHDGDLYWVTLITTNSGYGIDGVEKVYSVTWGDAHSPWAFTAGAPTEVGRDELVVAFVAAAARVADAPDPEPASRDEQAAQAALLNDEDLGQDWVSWPRMPQNSEAFHGLATSLMTDEPSCTAALEWLDSEDVELSGFLDVFSAGSIAGADGAIFVSQRDGMSDLRQTVLVFADAEQPAESLRSTRLLGWVKCATTIYDELAQVSFDSVFPGVTVSVVSAGERSLDLGDGSFAMRFELRLQAPDDGGDLEVVQDISIVTVGRAATTIVQQSFAGGIDDAEIDGLIELATERLIQQFGDPSDGGS
jgi:hypothetical protein